MSPLACRLLRLLMISYFLLLIIGLEREQTSHVISHLLCSERVRMRYHHHLEPDEDGSVNGLSLSLFRIENENENVHHKMRNAHSVVIYFMTSEHLMVHVWQTLICLYESLTHLTLLLRLFSILDSPWRLITENWKGWWREREKDLN